MNAVMPTPEEFELMQRMAKVYAESGIFNIKNVAQLTAMMLRAWGMGLPVTEGPELFQALHGKLTFSANAMATLMKRAGYNWTVEHLDNLKAHIKVYGPGGVYLGDSIFTMKDAEDAKITDKNNNWKLYPRNMLMARAISNAAKWYAADAFGGAPVYIPEELGGEPDQDDIEGEYIPEPDDTPAPAVNPDTGEVEPAHDDFIANTPVKMASKAQQTKIRAMFQNLFGDNAQNEWHEAIKIITDGRTPSTTEITMREASHIIDLLTAEELGRQVHGLRVWHERERKVNCLIASNNKREKLWELWQAEVKELLASLEDKRHPPTAQDTMSAPTSADDMRMVG